MAAGQKYNKTLNYDEHNVKTPAFYDPNLDEWLMASANVVKTEGGVFIFQKGTDDGKAKVLAELSGSNLPLVAGTAEIGKVQISSTSLALLAQQTTSAPSTGTKTVTATAAEAFSGASAKTNRKKMIIKNEDAVLRFRVGGVDITQDKGFTVEPKAFVEFNFDPSTYVPIYIIAETADLEVEVYEE